MYLCYGAYIRISGGLATNRRPQRWNVITRQIYFAKLVRHFSSKNTLGAEHRYEVHTKSRPRNLSIAHNSCMFLLISPHQGRRIPSMNSRDGDGAYKRKILRNDIIAAHFDYKYYPQLEYLVDNTSYIVDSL